MAGLPKKYAKMGFKKGWAAYRRSKGSRKASRTSRPRTVKRMARRRSYRGRKRASGSRKFNPWKLMKGIVYTGAIAAPAYEGYKQLGGGSAGAIGVAKSMAFVDAQTNQFSLAAGAQMWTPVAAVAVVDFVTTKLPIQRIIGRGVRNLLG